MNLIIVMAAYNGAAFIADQIRSIQDQTLTEWSLLIRDDGSPDDTVKVIRRFTESDSRITLLEDGLGNLGVNRNFEALLRVALDRGADYVALSDQDDIWQPEKLAFLLDTMRQTESENTTSPVLVHSDLEVVNEQMYPLHPSFMQYSRISPFVPRLEPLLCQNIVTGCTCLINRALLMLALPISKDVPMYDWWLALLALACGKMGYVDQALVRYRQHTGNVVGVKPYLLRVIDSVLRPGKWRQKIDYTRASIKQAGVLLERTRSAGAENQALYCINQYSKITTMPRLERLWFLNTHAIRKRSRLSDFLFKLIILSLPAK